MKTLYYFFVCMLIVSAVGCYKEDDPEPRWEYVPPVPEITDGPAEAQKMCYNLYQKYDLRVYYNLSGDTALRTDAGNTQTTMIRYNNSAAIPMQAADEVTAEKFLQLLTRFFDMLPDGVVQKGMYRRHILVKVNPGNNKFMDELRNAFWINTYAEDMQAVVYYGYLSNNNDTGDKFTTRFGDWKWGITYNFLRGLADATSKPVTLPKDFAEVSKGLYYDENRTGVDVCLKYDYYSGWYAFDRNAGKKCGLVHPLGAMASSKSPLDDFATFAAWIMTTPRAEREVDMAAYSRLKQKYNLVTGFYKSNYGMDLETLSLQWGAVTLDDLNIR